MRYKRLGVRLWFRLGHCCKTGWKVLFWLLTLLATVFTLVSASGIIVRWTNMTILVGIVFVISGIYGIAKSKVDHLPDQIIVCDEADEKYELCYEPKSVCLDFNQESAPYFGRDYLDEAVVERWWLKNPKAFIYLRNARMEPCAALCVFTLRHSFMEQFLRGRISDVDIDSEDILEMAASRKASSLYLSAIIVKDPHTQIGHRRAVVMVWATIQYLKRTFGVKKARTVFALPVNRASENLLKRLGFQVVCGAGRRRDGHDLYSFDVSAKNLATALERIGDHSGYCSIALN